MSEDDDTSDKTQAFHQLHQEQLCKLRLSIPSRNVAGVGPQRVSEARSLPMEGSTGEGNKWKTGIS